MRVRIEFTTYARGKVEDVEEVEGELLQRRDDLSVDFHPLAHLSGPWKRNSAGIYVSDVTSHFCTHPTNLHPLHAVRMLSEKVQRHPNGVPMQPGSYYTALHPPQYDVFAWTSNPHHPSPTWRRVFKIEARAAALAVLGMARRRRLPRDIARRVARHVWAARYQQGVWAHSFL